MVVELHKLSGVMMMAKAWMMEPFSDWVKMTTDFAHMRDVLTGLCGQRTGLM